MSAAIEALQQQRHRLLSKKEAILEQLNKEISEIEVAIETISGKHVWETEPLLTYDDTNPDYIRASIEEL